MELITEQEKELKVGSSKFNLPQGKTLKIETTDSGEEILNFTADKGYKVSIHIHLEEDVPE